MVIKIYESSKNKIEKLGKSNIIKEGFSEKVEVYSIFFEDYIWAISGIILLIG